MPSLRLRLLVVLSVIHLVVLLVVAIATLYSTHHEVEELFDAHLAQSARILLDIDEQFRGTAVHPHDLPTETLPSGHPYVKHIAFQIWKDGVISLHSPQMPHTCFTEAQGFSDITLQGNSWRAFRMEVPESTISVVTAERTYIREELVRYISLSTLLPLLVAAPFLALLIWLGVGRGIAPLQTVANEVEQRSPKQLSAVPTEQVPIEVKPLVTSINHLLERLQQALENERRFTADAAHELRTPLASLKVQAQVAERASDAATRQHALQQIIAGVNRSTHLVEQLLTLARLDPETASRQHLLCDLREIAEETLALQAPFAIQKRIDLSLHGEGAYPVLGDATAIGVLIRNLVDNALRYTPARGMVEVHLTHDAQGTTLSVQDSGPGIPPEMWADVFKRFRRGNHGETFGCGLGLSIVQRICELHQGIMRVDSSALGGLNMVVVFPSVNPEERIRLEPAQK